MRNPKHSATGLSYIQYHEQLLTYNGQVLDENKKVGDYIQEATLTPHDFFSVEYTWDEQVPEPETEVNFEKNKNEKVTFYVICIYFECSEFHFR